MNKFTILLLILVSTSCKKKEAVDTLVINAKVYTVNENFDQAQAFAIKDGKFIDVGSTSDMQSAYEAANTIDAQGKTVLPGLMDAHCHFYGLGMNQTTVDLVGASSYDDMMKRVLDFHNANQSPQLMARGWDETTWEDKTLPGNGLLNQLFPKEPVLLRRIDGHAAIANQAALDLGNITPETKVEGGEIEVKDDKLTGLLVDNAVNLVLNHWPEPTRKDKVKGLLAAQDICLALGLTTVDDAGLDPEVIDIIDSLQQKNQLKIRMYAMVSASKENLDTYLKKGIYKTDKLHVRSFKIYADGALGSRGALLREPYTDKDNHFGLLRTSLDTMTLYAERIANSEFQMNTHAIGDSANHFLLETYSKVLQDDKDRRWRIEHAQVIAPEDFQKFNNIIPSVQPTHATSDMRWAEDRLGKERVKGAYAYKDLLNSYGKIALGTDFPVEQVSPFLTFYAAVARKDLNGEPTEGFQMEQALTREETLKGMTIWAAYANFEEQEKGSIEPGKFADFIILDQNIMTIDASQIPKTKVEATYIDGEKI